MFLKEDFDNSENMCFTIKLQIPGNLLQRNNFIARKRNCCSRPCKSMALNKYCTNINCKYAHSKEELHPYICKRDGKCIVSHCWFYHPKQESKNNYINRNFSKKDLLYYNMLPKHIKKTNIIYICKNNKKGKKIDWLDKCGDCVGFPRSVGMSRAQNLPTTGCYVSSGNIKYLHKIIKYILTKKKYSIELFF